MPGLAELILAEGEGEEDELDDEGRRLAEELAELQARRGTGRPPPQAPPTKPGPAATEAAGAPGQTQRRAHARSLADAILSQAEAGDGVDRELEDMERELEENLQRYRKEASEQQTDAAPTGGAPSADGPQASGELGELRSSVAKMEEAFPETDSSAAHIPQRPRVRQSRQPRSLHREADLAAAPADLEVSEMQSDLDNLDVRLRALQSREVWQALESKPVTMAMSAEASRAMAEMQAQNKHLRERFSGDTKGLLKLDRGLFHGDKASVGRMFDSDAEDS